MGLHLITLSQQSKVSVGKGDFQKRIVLASGHIGERILLIKNSLGRELWSYHLVKAFPLLLFLMISIGYAYASDGIPCKQVSPTADEICDNGIDDDGDGLIDCQDQDCSGFSSCSLSSSCGSLGENLVLNGDFEQGYFGFSSDYGRGTNNRANGTCDNNGWYIVGKRVGEAEYTHEPGDPGSYTSPDPNDISNSDVILGNHLDHTDGDGFFLYADPNNIEGSSLWYQDISVCEGQKYIFSIWLKTFPNREAVNLSLQVDGQLLLPYRDYPSTEWVEVAAEYVATKSGVCRIAIVNGGGCDGNDPAIDDISFRACGGAPLEISSEVAICVGEDIAIRVSSQDSTVQNPAFQWQRSEDGLSWEDISGAIYAGLVYPNPGRRMKYRVLFSHEGNMGSPSCRVVSNVVEPFMLNCLAEICNNGIDDDGDGFIDEADADCPTEKTPVCEGEGIKYYLPAVSGNNTYGYPHSLFISTSFPTANVNITTADGSYNRDVTLTSDGPVEITLPEEVVASFQVNFIEKDKGLILTSDVPVIPVYRITHRYSRMLANLKGQGALGRNFRLASAVRAGGNEGTNERHFFSVMATEDSTVITIDESPYPLRGIILPYSVTLNAGETFLAVPDDATHHITGTLVVAEKPVAVMAGTQTTIALGSGGNRDNSGDLVIPFSKIGKDYVVIRGGFSSSLHDYVMAVATVDGTQVFLDDDPAPQATLQAGEYALIEVTGNKGDPHYIHANRDVYIYHISGTLSDQKWLGEFGMAVLPPINSSSCTGIKSIAVPKFSDTGAYSDLYVITPTASLGGLTIDGQAYTSYGTAQPVPGYPEYSSIYLNQNTLPQNVNFIKSDDYFYVGHLVAVNGTGAYGYYSEYESRVDVLDPNLSLPTTYYVVDTVCLGSTINHTLTVESCGNEHKIVSGVQGVGSISFPYNSLSLSYTANELGLDVVQVIVENEDGFKGTVCLGFFVQEATADAGPDQEVCSGEAFQLDGKGGVVFEWSPAEGLSDTNIANPLLQPSVSKDFQLTVTDNAGCTDVDSVKITVNPTPTLASQRPRLCEDDSKGVDLSRYELLMNLWNVNGRFSYFDETWNPIPNPGSFDALDEAIVNVEFETYATGCKDSAVLIFDIQPSILIPSKVIEVCPGDAFSIDLTLYEPAISNKAGVYTYYNAAGQVITSPEDIDIQNGENIRVNYVSDLCEANATYTFRYRTPPVAFAGNDTSICPGESLPLSGSGGIILKWASDSTLSDSTIANPMAFPTTLREYVLTVQDEFGCEDKDTVAVNMHTVLPSSLIFESSICQGDSVQLYASGGTAYSWDNELSLSNPTSASPIAKPGISTLYTVEVTDANGCKRNDSLQVNVRAIPKADAGEDVDVCIGDRVRLIGGRGASYSWSPTIGLSNANVSSPVFLGEETTNYLLTVSNAEGCLSTDSMTVTVHSLPDVKAMVSHTEICKDEPVDFEATGASTYRWLPESEFPDPTAQKTTVNPSVPSLYVLEGRSEYGCIARDSAFILIHHGPNALVRSDSSICEGDTISLGASGGASFDWSTAEPLDTIQVAPTSSTDYWVIPYSNKGCPGDTAFSFVRTIPYPVARFSPEADSGFVPVELAFFNESEYALDYLWDFGDQTTSREENPAHLYDVMGKYTVALIAFNELGCKDSTSFSPLDIIKAQVIGANAFTPNGDGLNDVFRFMAMGVERMKMQIFNRFGNLVFEESSKEPVWDGTMNGVPVPGGNYVYRLEVVETKGYTYTRVGNITLIR